MDELANKHWDGSGPGSRIRWVEGVARRYFLDGDWRRFVGRAKRRARAAGDPGYAGAGSDDEAAVQVNETDEGHMFRELSTDDVCIISATTPFPYLAPCSTT